MITLAILEKMASDGVAGLKVDKDFFWEELPLQKDGKPAEGVWIVTRGGSAQNTPNGINQQQTIDFYVAYANKVKAETTLEAIAAWIRNNLGICELSGTVGGSSYAYTNIRIRPTTTPQNYGATENGNIVKLASADVRFDNK